VTLLAPCNLEAMPSSVRAERTVSTMALTLPERSACAPHTARAPASLAGHTLVPFHPHTFPPRTRTVAWLYLSRLAPARSRRAVEHPSPLAPCERSGGRPWTRGR